MDGRRFSLCLSLSFALFLHRQSVFPRRAFLLNMHRTNNQNVKSLASFHSTFQYIYINIYVWIKTHFSPSSANPLSVVVSRLNSLFRFHSAGVTLRLSLYCSVSNAICILYRIAIVMTSSLCSYALSIRLESPYFANTLFLITLFPSVSWVSFLNGFCTHFDVVFVQEQTVSVHCSQCVK